MGRNPFGLKEEQLARTRVRVICSVSWVKVFDPLLSNNELHVLLLTAGLRSCYKPSIQ